MDIGADKLRREIQIILKDADLNTLSSKKVRQMLEALFKCDFTERKKEIDDILIQINNNNNQQTTKSDEELAMEIHQQENRPSLRHSRPIKTNLITTKKSTTTKSERRKTSYNKELDLSDQLASIVGGNQMPRSEVVKRMWAYFKQHNLLDPNNKQYVNCDETLTKLFGRKRIRAFGMLKDLTKHMSDPDKQ
ncbi:unnamed protein product [Rotaria sp. Silwood1]|nr:unnamed protein product [Rotaria sp. Silwood1]